jgi:hypothetical protein
LKVCLTRQLLWACVDFSHGLLIFTNTDDDTEWRCATNILQDENNKYFFPPSHPSASQRVGHITLHFGAKRTTTATPNFLTISSSRLLRPLHAAWRLGKNPKRQRLWVGVVRCIAHHPAIYTPLPYFAIWPSPARAHPTGESIDILLEGLPWS